ncbi:MAG: mitochondrial fission ELM1 family protein [Proteobacteria bacterium]|nr:mitochondrial fission ELM1 family protein [Pseudomonadota bacterium]
MTPDTRPLVWVVCDDKQGITNQCVGVAEAIDAEPVIKYSRPRWPWSWLPAAWWPWPLSAQRRGAAPLAPPWPDLVIAAGRTGFAPAVAIRRRAGGKTLLVAIQNPRMARDQFDLIIVPAHDRLEGPNVLVTEGAPHRVTAARLAADAAELAPRLAYLPRPLVAVLIGGSNRFYRLDATVAAAHGAALAAFARRHGLALALTPSRRTPADVIAALRRALAEVPAFVWDGGGPNPYFGLLGLADAIVVTADSVSMTSEAAVTGKPVYVLALPGRGGKFAAFHARMAERGITRPFTGDYQPWTYPAPDDMARAAAAIRRLLATRGGMARPVSAAAV